MLIAGIILTVLLRTVTTNKELLTRVLLGIMIISTIIGGYSLTTLHQAILGGLYHTNYVITLIEMGILIISIGAIALIIGSEYNVELRIIILCSVVGMITLINSYDIISTYLAIELLTLTLYVITTISRYSVSAGLKYYILGCMSSALLLLGLVLLYSGTGLTQYDALALLGGSLLVAPAPRGPAGGQASAGWYPDGVALGGAVAPQGATGVSAAGGAGIGPVGMGMETVGQYMEIAIVLIIISLLFKIGAAPFHYWAPDIYDSTPTIITTWIAIMGKYPILSFVLILKCCLNGTPPAFGVQPSHWASLGTAANLIFGSALISLVLGSILGLVQHNLKRLLAYSTITHLGYILIGLTLEGEVAVSALCFYMIQYWWTFYNMLAILIKYEQASSVTVTSRACSPPPRWGGGGSQRTAGSASNRGEGSPSSRGPRSVWTTPSIPPSLTTLSYSISRLNPACVSAIIITLFSLTGIPPLIGFFGKIMIINITLGRGYYSTATIIIITSVISAAFYLHIVISALLPPTPPLPSASGGSRPGPSLPQPEDAPVTSCHSPWWAGARCRATNGGHGGRPRGSRPLSWIISISTLIITLYIINTTTLTDITHRIADTLA